MNKLSSNKMLIMVLIALVSFKANYGQETNGDKKQDKAVEIQSIINSKRYSFVAQTALPTTGRSINLTTPYDLRVSGDTVIADLPYFGRAYTAPIDPSGGGIHFKATKVDYNLKERKKGGWDITILPKDATDVRQMYLSVTESGFGTLQVISNNRQAIQYNGYVIAWNGNNKSSGKK